MSSGEASGSEQPLPPAASDCEAPNVAQMLPPAAAAAAHEGPGSEEPLAHSAAAAEDLGDEQPQQAQQPQPSLDVLPNDVLSRVFVLIGAQEGRSLPLVSHRWHDLYFSEPRLWSPFTVSCASMAKRPQAEWQGWLARRAALAQRVSQQVTRLEWRADEMAVQLEGPSALAAIAPAFMGGLASFLEAMQPSRLAELDVWSLRQLPQAAAAALAHLTGVTHLDLVNCQPEAAAAVVNALRGGLLSVFCRPWHDTRLADALCSLPRLEHISVTALGAQLPAAPLQQLTRLTQLRELDIESEHDQPMHMPDPASFANLESCSMGGLWHPLEIAGAQLERIMMARTTFIYNVGGGLRPLRTLELESVLELPSLRRLLEAVLPPAALPLERLVLRSSTLDACSLGNCPQLHHLQELYLIDAQGSDGIGAELAALLQQAPHLAALLVIVQPDPNNSRPAALTWDSVRPHLSACTQLTELILVGQPVRDLPHGDYLAGLRSLTLMSNPLRKVPPTLSAATQLTFLHLWGNPFLALSEADVEILASLPSLRYCSMWRVYPDPAVYVHLAASLPNVQLTFEMIPLAQPSSVV